MSNAITWPNVRAGNDGLEFAHNPLVLWEALVTFGGTYAQATGEAFDPAAAQAGIPSNAKISWINVLDDGSDRTVFGIYHFVWDKTNKKIRVYKLSDGTELGDGSAALAGKTIKVLIAATRN